MEGKMNKRENLLLKRNDFEKYQLVLPYRFLFGRRRNRFIYSELEKMHPCFSDEFCFDVNVRSLSKKGLVSDVMVIHKYLLAEYEAKRSLSDSLMNRRVGSGFYAEACRKKRFFVNEKLKAFSQSGFFILLLLFVLVSFSLFSVARKDRQEKASSRQSERLISESSSAPLVEEKASLISLGESLFTLVEKTGGRILDFHWELDGYKEVLEVRLKGVFPEELGEIKASAVNYENEIPLIQAAGVRKVSFDKRNQENQADEELQQGFYQALRGSIHDNRAVLKKEDLNPYRICFSCGRDNICQLLLAMDQLFLQGRKSLSLLDVKALDENNFEFLIGEMKNDLCPVDSVLSLKLLAENFSCLGEAVKKKASASAAVKKAKAGDKENPALRDAVKIGQIKDSEGKIISFYKNSQGKLLKVMEEK